MAVENRFFDPEKKYESLAVGCVEGREIHLYKSVRKICDICGFEMRSKILEAGKDIWVETAFKYKDYRFFELQEVC